MTASADTGAVGSYVQSLTVPPDVAQADFRALLAALAEPGTLTTITPPAGVPAALAVAAGLADVEVPVCVLTGAGTEHWTQALQLATSAPSARLEDARMIVALRSPSVDEVAALPRGDALHPELGARLILTVAGLTVAEDTGTGTVLALAGPGVPGSRRIRVSGPPSEVFHALAAVNTAFPAGVDTFLVAADGTVAGLPRSTRISIENGED
jgi:alpha-D-ribose 1-methylphosphonate 5-triphosphate synthase subunit PhnH